MKKTFKLMDLDCAHCASKIEGAVKKINGATNVEVHFLSQKMVLEAADDRFQEIAEEAVRLIKKIEPDVTVQTM
ncbi:MAG: cation transporter [Hungatella hathewayi]|uniref:cation transporter n=1 Tax=Hungatella TaxID=1649459 RepID=UPI001106C044|nr:MULTISPECIES: cation transporter [Hungatella]MCI7384855.1 cation transporter [Hungatella sp.]MDY6238988.1 cation transporter [Hungatella hathewayi]